MSEEKPQIVMLTNEDVEDLIRKLEKLRIVYRNFESEPTHEMNQATNIVIQFLKMLPTMD